ncbi:hypothetical protein BH23VER1_BH23VER1_13040 [soil metagenome]
MAFLVEAALAYLDKAHAAGRLAHAYLVSGATREIQEAFVARSLRALNGWEIDSLDAAQHLGASVLRPSSKTRWITVDQIRDLEHSLYLRSSRSRYKVAIICEADRMRDAPVNAFLKTLEEPPPGCLIFLLTEMPERLLDTVLSRCIRVVLRRQPGEHRPPSDPERALLESLADLSRRGDWNLGSAFAFRHLMSGLLKEIKDAFLRAAEAEMNEEKDHYAQRIEGDYLKRREAELAALASGEYLAARIRLLNVLGGWFGDALLHGHGLTAALEFPAYSKATAALAQSLPEPELLRRAEGVDFLRRQLDTNVQEQLALEVACLKILG